MIETTALQQIVYVSAATRAMDEPDLRDLLAEARHFNEANGVTGMLLYCDDTFMQVLEGARTVLEPLYVRICRDRRHARVLSVRDDWDKFKLWDLSVRNEEVRERSFGGWSMAFHALDRHALPSTPGFSDFLMRGSPLHERLSQSEDAAHRLLTAFRACSAMVPTLDEDANTSP